MREIKFRAIDIHTGKFVYGHLINVSCTKSPHPETAWRIAQSGLDCIIYTPIKPNTIGEYTGLKDKNGKEIYSDDLIQWGSKNEIYQIIWIEDECRFGLTQPKLYGTLKLTTLVSKNCEIVGNIYETPMG